MASFEFTSPEGKKYTVQGPDGATQEQAFQMLQAQIGQPAPKPGLVDSALDFAKKDLAAIPGRVGNLAAGAVRGAGSLGATLTDLARSRLADPVSSATPQAMRPAVTAGLAEAPRGKELRAGMDAGLTEMGADPNSAQFKTAKTGMEIAGTAGVGGAVANALRAAGAAPALVEAVASGGMSGGGNMLTRMIGGGINGGATAGLVDPEHAGTGALIGGAAPLLVQGAGAAGEWASDRLKAAANKLMESALKPTLKMHQTGDAATATQTLLDNGLNATKGGTNKLRSLIDDLNNQITNKIAGSPATVSKGDVLDAAWKARQKFTNQVDPAADLNAIDGMIERFYLNKNVPEAIPVQQAQDLKQGTYKVLAKKYGQLGSADVEGQKAMARGLKEGIADAVPDIAGLNAQESKLITTLKVAERRALMDMNKNPMGLAALAHSPASWAMFMADKSALFKSLAARMVNNAAPAAGAAGQKLIGAASNPLLRTAGVEAISANP